MIDQALTDAPGNVTVGPRRAGVLAALRRAPCPLSVQQVAEYAGIHRNTARFHLDGLVSDGLAERTDEARDTPGRPRGLYAAREQAPGLRSYRLLAEILTGVLSSLDHSGSAATETGRAWGRHLVDRPPPSQRIDSTEATARLVKVLDAIGFRPETHVTADEVHVHLHHCPFLEVATLHRDVVCAIHRGLIQGALGELRAPLEVEALDAFVGPNLCVARLRPAG